MNAAQRPRLASPPRILATDLDGTLIPLPQHGQHVADLRRLAELLAAHRVPLVFVTGRHLASVESAIAEHQLPSPQWILSDVGTTMWIAGEGEFTQFEAYRAHLAELIADFPLAELQGRLRDWPDLQLQEPKNQGAFKLSFYSNAELCAGLADRLRTALRDWQAPYSVIDSLDPFTDRGLIDLLPREVSKAYALDWWCQHAVSMAPEAVLFAGDSGNDLAALVAGYRSIVVANAHESLALQVQRAHQQAGWQDRLYLAEVAATSGVLAGCHWFGLFPD